LFGRETNKAVASSHAFLLPHHHNFNTPPTTTKSLYLSPKMAEQSIKSLFSSAERQRKDIEASWDSNTATYQQNLAAAISTYEDCLKLADRLSLFSPNETLEDLTSGDLQYVSLAFQSIVLISGGTCSSITASPTSSSASAPKTAKPPCKKLAKHTNDT